MNTIRHRLMHRSKLAAILGLSLFSAPLLTAAAQEPRESREAQRAPQTPEEKVQRIAGVMNRLVTGGRATNVVWSEDGPSPRFIPGRFPQRFGKTFPARDGRG